MNIRDLIQELQEIVEREPHRDLQTVHVSYWVEDPDDGDLYEVIVDIDTVRVAARTIEIKGDVE